MGDVDIFCAGGTIDKVYFDALSSYQVGEPQVERILSSLRLNLTYTVTSVVKKDSLDMTDEDRQALFDAVSVSPACSVVVTHGSDTMVDTARFLSSVPDKSIVLTGASQPALFADSDAVFNVAMALSAAQTVPPGSYVAMSGRVFGCNNVEKDRDAGYFREL